MVFDGETVQLEDELTVGRDEAFVFRAAVVAAYAEEALIEAAGGHDVMNRQQRLRSHRR